MTVQLTSHLHRRAAQLLFNRHSAFIYNRRYLGFWYLICLAIGLSSFAGCEAVLRRTDGPKNANLNGRWVMGNATSGTEASTIIRIDQNGQDIKGILEEPSKDYAEQYGVKKGDLEFEGKLEGRTVRGKVYSYKPLDIKEMCPQLQTVTLKDVELSLSPDENSLDGSTASNRVNEQCQEYIRGRSPYTFQRLR